MMSGVTAKPPPWAQWKQMLDDPEPDPLEVARLAASHQRYLAALEEHEVAAARRSGHSRAEIAEAVGTTRQAAWSRLRYTLNEPEARDAFAAEERKRLADLMVTLERDRQDPDTRRRRLR